MTHEQAARIIQLLEEMNRKLDRMVGPTLPQINIPTVFGPYVPQDVCSDNGLHDYPNPWHSVTPPHCKKCGKQAQSWLTTTVTSGTELKIGGDLKCVTTTAVPSTPCADPVSFCSDCKCGKKQKYELKLEKK